MERAFQHLELSHSQIEQACRQYFQNKGSLQSFKILSGGAVNTTFKIRWDNEWYVLRFYVRDKNLASIEKQIYQLVQATVPVPEMLFASSSDESYPFSIFRLIEKPHIHDASKTQSHRLSYDLGCACLIVKILSPEAERWRKRRRPTIDLFISLIYYKCQ